MKNWYVFLFVMVLMTCFASTGFGAILLAEVSNDPATPAFGGTDPNGEYIIICNTGPSNVNIKNYSFNDNSAFASRVVITTSDYNIAPAKCALVIRQEPSQPDVLGASGYNCGANPPNQLLNAGTWGNNFSNAGDRIYLFDPTATATANAIDSMSYGSDVTVFPTGTLPVATNTGRVFRRTNYPSNITALGSPSTASDWQIFNPLPNNTSTEYGVGVTPCSAPITSPTAAQISLSGRITDQTGNQGVSMARITIQEASTGRTISVNSNPFGYYQADELEAGETYVVKVSHKKYNFSSPQTITLFDNLSDFNFSAE